MNKLRLLSLFSGIGAFEKALTNIGINYELVGFSEIDKYAINSYCAIHRVDKMINLNDVSKINVESLPKDIDMITHGSPCQDYSLAGKGEGGDKGSGTRSSLMWYSIEIIKHCKPKYVIWENVKNVLSKKHKHNFDKYIEDLNNLGYTSYYQVLNAKDYGIPQNRERIYCISILGEHNPYEFPKEKELTIRLKDILEETVEDKYYLNKKWHFTKPNEQKHDINEIAKIDNINYRTINTITNPNKICRCLDTMCGGQREPKIIEIAKTEDRYDQASRVYGIEGLSPSLLARDCRDAKKILEENYRIRKLTPLECWRLMGFSDEDFYKAQSIPTSNTQLYKQAGNSIVVNVLEEIFKQLFNL